MKRVAGNFFWSAFGKILDAACRFVSVPLVLHHFGKSDFGLTALASSINVFLQIADFGMNVGAVKILSESLKDDDVSRLKKIIQSGMALYTWIGCANALVLLVIGVYCGAWFNLDYDQTRAFRWMLLAMATYSMSNWVFAIFRQMVLAAGMLGWDERNNLIASIASFIFALLAVNLDWTIETYYAATLLALSAPIVLRVKWCKANIPGVEIGWHWHQSVFTPALATSGVMLAIGLVQSLANNARPFLLANQSGIQAVADYRVIQQIVTLIALIGGSLFNTVYPEISRLIANKHHDVIKDYAENGTKLLLAAYLVICSLFALFSQDILRVYLGDEYVHLSLDLTIWCFTVLTGHVAILSSVAILDSRPFSLLVFSSFSCLASLVPTYFLSTMYGVSAAVWGYAAYAFLQVSFFYLYISPRQGVISRGQYFSSFLPLTIFAGVVVIGARQCRNLGLGSSAIINAAAIAVIGIILILVARRGDGTKQLLNRVVNKTIVDRFVARIRGVL